MTSLTGTMTTTTARTSRPAPLHLRVMRELAGSVGAAFESLRQSTAAIQLGAPTELSAGRWAGVKA